MRACLSRWSRVGTFCLAVLVGVGPAGPLAAQEDDADVALRKLVLYSSGVGFFEHAGAVDGEARLELKFRTEEVNDLLKSLVVQDLDGGQVSTVTYDSREPITRTLQTFAIDLSRPPTLAQLLTQIRGEGIELEAPNKIAGTIVSVETRRRKVDDEVIERDVLNLLTEDGLRSLPLENVGRIKLLNERLDGEFRQALQVLAAGLNTERKSVELRFQGEGRRRVRLGYVRETPIWKTSYRLVLRDDAPPFLQGWAIVENMTEEDWSDVSLTLVSGRPISFRMDLYQPLYVPRPTVVPELFASLLPKVFDQDLARRDRANEGQPQRFRYEPQADDAAEPPPPAESAALGRMPGPGRGGFGMGGMGDLFGGEDPMAGVRSVADAGEVGELFQYRIETPVTVERQRSAMLPIVNEEVQGDKVSIYNEETHDKHPLNGLRLTNATGLHLMQGPITVFDGGAYAGDARLADLAPDAERLIAYALDLDTEVAVARESSPRQLVEVKIVRGTLHASRKDRRATEYRIRNSGARARTVLVEHPWDADWTLVSPDEPDETTRDLYRFSVETEPDRMTELAVVEERTLAETFALTDLDADTIRLYLTARTISDEVKDTLREAARLMQELARLAAQRRELQGRVQSITEEQDRIRKNLAGLDRTTDLYQRYVRKLDEQEDEIETLRADIRRLQEQEAEKRAELEQFLNGLTVS